jgi:hypothetical protein
MSDIKTELSKLIQTFNSKRVISEGEIQDVFKVIITILAENKKGVDSLNADTKKQLQQAIDYISNEHDAIIAKLTKDVNKTRLEIEKSVKDQNDRSFKRLQELMGKIKLLKDGQDGKDGAPGQPGQDGKNGSPDTAFEVRDKLETLEGDDRLDAKYIKGWDRYFGKVVKKGKEMLVGGIRFLENLVDVAIVATKKRQDLLIQYNNTTKRWENGLALTVSTTAPTSPQTNDLWVDIS